MPLDATKPKPVPERTEERERDIIVAFRVKVYGTDRNVDDAVQDMARRIMHGFDVVSCTVGKEGGQVLANVDISPAKKLVHG